MTRADGLRFAQETLEALLAAIDINDRIDRDAPLPDRPSLDHPPAYLIEGFALSRQLWREGLDRDGMLDLTTGLRDGRPLDAGRRAWFKDLRARFKHLRFAFFLYSEAHRSPPLLSLVTLVMGELQDATRVGSASDVCRHARRLRLLLTAPAWALLRHEADRFVPSDPAGLRDFTLAQIASLAPLLARTDTDAHAFHAARKVISRQVSFHDDMRTLHPSEDHRAMARWLATINGLMGQFHDELVAGNAVGRFDYRRDRFVLPSDIRDRLAATVALYRGSSSSIPSAA